MSAGPNGPCPYLGEPSVTRTRTRVLPFISRLPEPLGWVCVYYFRGCQCLWARPLHSHHILFRGYRLLVPSRLRLITYHIWVQYPLYPIYTAPSHTNLMHNSDKKSMINIGTIIDTSFYLL